MGEIPAYNVFGCSTPNHSVSRISNNRPVDFFCFRDAKTLLNYLPRGRTDEYALLLQLDKRTNKELHIGTVPGSKNPFLRTGLFMTWLELRQMIGLE